VVEITKLYPSASSLEGPGDGETCRIGESRGGGSFRARLIRSGFSLGYNPMEVSMGMSVFSVFPIFQHSNMF
jgi:hypothetical protein